jgi:hypothetical protein
VGIGSLVVHPPRAEGDLLLTLPDGTRVYQPSLSSKVQQTLNYPLLHNFTREAWEYFIVKYRREHIRARPENVVPISACIDPSIIQEMCNAFAIEPSAYHSVSNDDLVALFYTRFGPPSAAIAKDRFVHKQFKFNDNLEHQNTFASKLNRFFQEKIELLQDFTLAERNWAPGDEFTHTMIIEALTTCFPLDSTASNNAFIRSAIRDNRTKHLFELKGIIVGHFRQTDLNVERKQGQYHVFPSGSKFKKRDRDGSYVGDRPHLTRPPFLDRGAAPTRGHIRDGGGRPNLNVHDRGVCGSRKHKCSASTCLFWGEPEAKPLDYVWGPDERSVYAEPARFAALKAAKPAIAALLTSNSSTPTGPPSASRGGGIPGGYRGRGSDNRRGGPPPRGRSADRSDDVNPRRYSLATVHAYREHNRDAESQSSDPHTGGELLPGSTFYAIARIEREHMGRSPRCTRTLMDTGADMNIIRASIVNDFVDSRAAVSVVQKRENAIILTNNGKPIGSSTHEVQLNFTLETLPGVNQTAYTEWFHLFDDLADEMVLGSAFNRTHGFSKYHELLVEWTGTECPRMRDRIVTSPEKRDAIIADLRNLKRDVSACAKKPGTNVPIIRKPELHGVQHYPLPANMQGKTPARSAQPSPIAYDRVQSKELAVHLARTLTFQRFELHKQMSEAVKNDAAGKRLSETDVESMLDSCKLAAQETEQFYYENAHLMDKKFAKPGYTAPANKRYFMEGWTPPLQPKENDAQPKFPYGHVAVLQNLQNFPALNGCPARVLQCDDDNKYVIHVASQQAPPDHRGYWKCGEQFLRSLDPVKPPSSGPISAATADLADMGIDHESGNPTLDPEHRPVHRQFGQPISARLTEQIRLLREKYAETFGTDIRKPCKFKPMGIELVPNAVLPRSPRFWKNSPEMRAEVRRQLQKLIADNVVVPSTTAIVSNVLLVKRPGMPGKFRFTVDLRQINQATVPVKWCMPDVQNQLDRLKGCRIFGALDISQYYHQIELEKGSQYLTGFITEDGVYQYQRVPMGLTSACSWAQQELQKAIDSDEVLRRYNVRNYFDDIPIGANTEEEFLEVLEALLALCQNWGLKVNGDKSIFGVDSITHVGFLVDANGARVDPMRTQSFRDMQAPSSVKGVQAVLGAMNYVRHFVPNFSVRAKALSDLVGGRKQGERAPKFVWTDAAQRAFDDLKQAVVNTVPLAFLDYSKEIFIRCDSSQFGAGAVLFQFDANGREHPVAYASRKYTIAERNYNTFQQEASVIVWSLEKFAEYFQGHPVTVQSDHRNLSWIKRSAMPQLTRWRIRLQDFDFKIEYLPGSQQLVADGLSRMCVDDKDLQITMGDFLPTNAAAISLLNSPVPLRALNHYGQHISGRAKTTAERIWDAQEVLHDDVHSTDLAPSPEQPLHYASTSASDADSDSDAEGDATRHVRFEANGKRSHSSRDQPQSSATTDERPTIPDLNDQDVNRLLASVHSDITGHAGVFTTLQRALTSHKGSWANRKQMLDAVDAFISGCPCCQKYRKRRTHADHRFVIDGSPFSQLSIDILQLPRADCHGCKYVVVIVDSFTRWTNCVPVSDKSALSAARALLQTIGIFGVPLTIRSDGGGEFINDVIRSLEHVLGTSHHKVSPYLHTGNSLAEKANRSILENLRNLIFDKRLKLHGEHQWSDLLPLAQRIINASFNSSIGCSPSQLLFGENIDLDRCLLRNQPAPVHADADDYISQLSANQSILLDAASLHLDAVHAANLAKWKSQNKSSLKLQAAMQRNPLHQAATEGAWVLARIPSDAPRQKWKPRWAGPFRLLDFKSQSQSIVRMFDVVSKKVHEAHINDVELWNHHFIDSVEGLTQIAEFDNWSYPMSAILAIALKPDNDDDEPIALPADHRRSANKNRYLVSVQWQGYAEPSWVPLANVIDTSLFHIWKSQRPLLRL